MARGRRAALFRLAGLAAAAIIGCGPEVDPPRTWVVYPDEVAAAEKHFPHRADAPKHVLPVEGLEGSEVANRAHVLYHRRVELVFAGVDQQDVGHHNAAQGRLLASTGVGRANEQTAQGKRLALTGQGDTVAQENTEGGAAQTAAAQATGQETNTAATGQASATGAAAHEAQAGGADQTATGGATGQEVQARRDEVRGEQQVRQAAVSRETRAVSSLAVLRARSERLSRLVETDRVLQHIFAEDTATFRKRLYRDLVPLPAVEATKEAYDAQGEALKVIVPGRTFEYRITVRNRTHAAISDLIIYDEFPRELRYEHRTERAVRLRGPRSTPVTPPPFLAFLTPNEWEDGKLAWALSGVPLEPGDALQLCFSATYYEGEGVPVAVGGAPPVVTTDDGREVQVTPGKDTVLVASRQAEGATILRVSVRRPDGQRVDGLMAAAAFDPRKDEDATDREKRLMATLYAGWEAAR